jgi:hypothetical protein
MKWKHWGRSKVKGTGKIAYFDHPDYGGKVKVTLNGLRRSNCSPGRFYSKAKIHSTSGLSKGNRYKLRLGTGCGFSGRSSSDLGSTSVGASTRPSQKTTKVICFTKHDPPTAAYERKPSKCILHRRGRYPPISADLAMLGEMRWTHWRARRAVGNGSMWISPVGPARVRVTLLKPRNKCGTRVYTKAKFRGSYQSQGETYHYRSAMPIDECAG